MHSATRNLLNHLNKKVLAKYTVIPFKVGLFPQESLRSSLLWRTLAALEIGLLIGSCLSWMMLPPLVIILLTTAFFRVKHSYNLLLPTAVEMGLIIVGACIAQMSFPLMIGLLAAPRLIVIPYLPRIWQEAAVSFTSVLHTFASIVCLFTAFFMVPGIAAIAPTIITGGSNVQSFIQQLYFFYKSLKENHPEISNSEYRHLLGAIYAFQTWRVSLKNVDLPQEGDLTAGNIVNAMNLLKFRDGQPPLAEGFDRFSLGMAFINYLDRNHHFIDVKILIKMGANIEDFPKYNTLQRVEEIGMLFQKWTKTTTNPGGLKDVLALHIEMLFAIDDDADANFVAKTKKIFATSWDNARKAREPEDRNNDIGIDILSTQYKKP